MRTRRHRNKTKNNRKRGGRVAAFTKRVHEVYDKYIRCCRPSRSPDGDGVAAAAAGVGPALPPPGSPPYVRQARGSRGRRGSPGASCVPCLPPDSSLPPIPPPRSSAAIPTSPSSSLSPIPRPSTPFRLATPDRLRRGQAALDEARGRASSSSSPQPPVSGTPTRSRRSHAHSVSDEVIQSCIHFWTSALKSRRERMKNHLSELSRVINSTLSTRNEQYSSILSDLIRNINSTAREILTARAFLRYWNSVLNGKIQRPSFQINPKSHIEMNRAFRYLRDDYKQALNDILPRLPILTESNIDTTLIDTFRRL
jgi:hypothetical protein